MEQILLKILDVSLSVGISFFIIYFFTRKLNEKDKYIQDLIEEFHQIAVAFTSTQQKMINKLDNIDSSLKELREDIETISEKILIIEQNTKK